MFEISLAHSHDFPLSHDVTISFPRRPYSFPCIIIFGSGPLYVGTSH